MDANFSGKVVIVTGASSGIGAAAALLFSKYGASLSLVGRNESRLNKTAELCCLTKGIKPLCFQADLTERGNCEKIIQETAQHFGRIDVLVNCAGKFVLGSLFDHSMEVFDDMLDINLRVPYKLTYLALPHLIKTRGNIVNLVTNLNDKSRHGFLPHRVAKCGLSSFSKMAAFELASEGIRVNSVNPGFTRTNIMNNLGMSDSEISTMYDRFKNEYNVKVLEPEEVAKMVVFLASDLCPSINGADFSMDNGNFIV